MESRSTSTRVSAAGSCRSRCRPEAQLRASQSSRVTNREEWVPQESVLGCDQRRPNLEQALLHRDSRPRLGRRLRPPPRYRDAARDRWHFVGPGSEEGSASCPVTGAQPVTTALRRPRLGRGLRSKPVAEAAGGDRRRSQKKAAPEGAAQVWIGRRSKANRRSGGPYVRFAVDARGTSSLYPNGPHATSDLYRKICSPRGRVPHPILP